MLCICYHSESRIGRVVGDESSHHKVNYVCFYFIYFISFLLWNSCNCVESVSCKVVFFGCEYIPLFCERRNGLASPDLFIVWQNNLRFCVLLKRIVLVVSTCDVYNARKVSMAWLLDMQWTVCWTNQILLQ